MKIEQLYQLYSKNNKIDTDTRSIRKGSLFFALKGENFNGNNFAHEALSNGAVYAIVDETISNQSDRIIKVDDVLKTLQKLALYHRKVLNLPILALTGSNGKTTTKELLYSLLSLKYKTVATIGNLNNHIGVPLTLLSMNESTEFGIVEMGANHLKEIELLCSICRPNFGFITNFGKAHLEGFGSIEGVIKGKSELYDHLRASDGLAFIDSEDPIQLKKSQDLRSISFSKKDFPLLHSTPFVTIQKQNTNIESPNGNL